MKRILAALAAATAILIPVTGAARAAHADTTCTAPIGSGCPGGHGYAWSGWPGSNGFNTYVEDQAVNVQPGSTGSVTATSPSSWTAQADYTSCGGCVQTYTAVQQLTNNWGNGGFNGSSNMPLNALKLLQVQYTESTPADPGNQYEFAPDLWTNYGSDIMMWADTSPTRCDGNGLSASDIIGQVNLGGQPWTVYTYGVNSEIIFVLDGSSSTDPMGTDTCAQQKSGTLHVLAALKWVSTHASITGAPAWSAQHMSQLDTGYEITAGDGVGQYQVSNLVYKVGIKAAA